MARVRICPSCGLENAVTALQCGKCRTNLAMVPIHRQEATAGVPLENNQEITIETPVSPETPSGTHCSDPTCAHLNPTGQLRCQLCNAPLVSAPEPTVDSPISAENNFPIELAPDYEVLRNLPTSDRAEFFLVKHRESSEQCLVKLFLSGNKPDSLLFQSASQVAPEHAVRLMSSGRSGNRHYQVQEFIRHGSLQDIVAATKQLRPDRLEEIAREIALGITTLHQHKIRHGNIIPSHILIRSAKPLDLVFTGFGVSATREEAACYRPPEGSSSTGEPLDYWALGRVLCTLLYPETFCVRETPDRDRLLRDNAVTESVRSLLMGLLADEPTRRWGQEEVSNWLGMRETSESSVRKNMDGFRFQRKQLYSPADIARAFALDSAAAVRQWENGKVARWFEQTGIDLKSRRLFKEILADSKGMSFDYLNLHFILSFAPSLPPVWKGRPITLPDLRALCASDAMDRAVFLADLYNNHALELLADALGDEYSVFFERVKGFIANYQIAVKRAVRNGANENMFPREEQLLSTFIQGALNPEAVEKLRSEVRSALPISHPELNLPSVDSAGLETLIVYKSLLPTLINQQIQQPKTPRRARSKQQSEVESAAVAGSLDQGTLRSSSDKRSARGSLTVVWVLLVGIAIGWFLLRPSKGDKQEELAAAPVSTPATSVAVSSPSSAPVPPVRTVIPVRPVAPVESVMGPSFDCTQAFTSVEKLICNDSEMSRVDLAMAELYRVKIQSTQYPEELREEQRNWVVSERNVCTDMTCLRDVYNYRINVLANRW